MDRLEDTSLAAARNIRGLVMAEVERCGYTKKGGIPEWMTFRQWCEDLASRGMKVDRKPFRLDDRPALIPIYDAIPCTRAEAFQWTLVVQKATQIGLTVWEVLATIYMAKKWGPINIGSFMPDQATASFKSERRFMPIIRSVPELLRELIMREEEGKARRIGEGNVLTREFGNSLLMFVWTSGKVTTESRPMDVVTLDEVQGMELEEIDKVFARLGDSDLQFKLLLSTANVAEMDINRWYMLGTQEVWHTRCMHCEALSDLSDPALHFPKTVQFNDGSIVGAPLNEWVYVCPHCHGWIEDAPQGEYIAANPDAPAKLRSFLLPRTISPRMTPYDLITQYQRAITGEQKKSFYNRTLARPYLDPGHHGDVLGGRGGW